MANRTASESINSLVTEHLQLARSLAGLMSLRLRNRVDAETLESDAYFGLLNAARRFRPEQGLQFVTFATPIINGAMLDALRVQMGIRCEARRRIKMISLSKSIDGEDGPQTLGDTLPSPQLPVGDRVALLDDVAAAMGRWPPRLRQIMVERHLHGLKQCDIARKFGISPSLVTRFLQQAEALADAARNRRNRDG